MDWNLMYNWFLTWIVIVGVFLTITFVHDYVRRDTVKDNIVSTVKKFIDPIEQERIEERLEKIIFLRKEMRCFLDKKAQENVGWPNDALTRAENGYVVLVQKEERLWHMLTEKLNE